MSIQVNYERLYQTIEDMSQYCLPDRPWTRRAFTPIYQQGRDWFAEQTKSVGAEVSYDVAGNLVSRIKGNGSSNKTIVIGSHLDTVPSGGRFDGIMGVLAGLEIARVLKEKNITLNHHFEIIDFLSEEPSEFGASCIGSRGLVGALPKDMLAYTDSAGVILEDVINDYHGDTSALKYGSPLRDDIACFLEYHIEQGHVLETKRLDVGVVTSIVGLSKIRMKLKGQSNHAGTTPMDFRKDSMVCLSEIILGMTQKAKEISKETGDYLVATAGKVVIFPNATNVVAGQAETVFDIRSDREETQDLFVAWLKEYCEEVSTKHENMLEEFSELSDSVLAVCAPEIVDLFEASAKDLGYGYQKMPSGAGHDCAFMTRIVPSAMIFCPSQNGLSHSPDEYSDINMVGKGCDVLLNTLLKADQYFSD